MPFNLIERHDTSHNKSKRVRLFSVIFSNLLLKLNGVYQYYTTHLNENEASKQFFHDTPSIQLYNH